MAQEHNIKDIKVTYRSEGPNIKWDYFKKLHPAIPTIRVVTEHVEKEFGTSTRGTSHTTPKRDKDVATARSSYRESTYHKDTKGRTIKNDGDRAEDYKMMGLQKVHVGDYITNWGDQRTFKRSRAERWGDDDSDDGTSEESTDSEAETWDGIEID